jgi:hypothetical protein
MANEVLSQRDPRWAKKTLGFTRTTIGNFGCTLVALTSWLNRTFGLSMTPDQVNQRLKDNKAYSDGVTIGKGNLIVWARVPGAFPDVMTRFKFVERGYNYSNVKVAWQIYVKNNPVLVEVNGAKIGAPRHWVLFIGGQKAMDPWTGKIISTSYYPATGYAIFSKA